ncbi:MAG: hypothetical protein ACLFTZ_06370 [Acholeplasmataceae bacterium]
MRVIGIILIVYGGFLLVALFLQFPFIYDNFKSKALIARIGKRAFDYVLFALGLAFLLVGILLT